MEIDIVLIHGFGHRTSEERFRHLILRLKREIPRAHIIPVNYLKKYPNKEIKTKIFHGKESLEEYAEIVCEKIESQRKHRKLIIIGTSLGGLVARVVIEKKGVRADAVILAGVPNNGVNINPFERIGLIFSKKKWVEEIKKGNKFLSAMNEELKTRNLSTKYYLMAGLKDKRVPKKSALALKAARHIEVDASHWEIIPQPESNPTASGEIFDIIMEWIQEAAK